MNGAGTTPSPTQQRKLFEEAAREQEPLLQEIAQKRFPLVAAFH